MIKTDPNQTKAVVVLLVILGGAVAVTVLRINPNSGQPATAAAADSGAIQAGSTPTAIVKAGATTRNPFRKPEAIREAFSRIARPGDNAGAVVVQEGSGRSSGSFKLPPMTVGVLPRGSGSADRSDSTQTDKTETPKPQFDLLATVRGPKGLTAVIRGGESDTRLVAVGDVLDGGYKILTLDEDRAILTNGSDVVVIKRPS